MASIDAELKPRLYQYMGGILQDEDCRLLAAGGVSDHVHLLADLGRQTCVAELMRLVKCNSSKWVHETFPGRRDFAWQNGYGAFSVSMSNIQDVKAYIEGQVEHHRTQSFQEEFLAFLQRHQVAYDPRYVFA